MYEAKVLISYEAKKICEASNIGLMKTINSWSFTNCCEVVRKKCIERIVELFKKNPGVL